MSQCKITKGFWLIIFLLMALAVALTNAFLSIRLQNTIKGNLLNIVANISYSYIVSYIFYAVALIPSKRDKKKLTTYLLNKASIISNEIDELFNKLFAEFQLENKKENLTSLCNSIIISNKVEKFSWMSNENGKMDFYNPTFGAYIDSVIKSVEKNIHDNDNLFLISDNIMYGYMQAINQSKFFQIYHNALFKNDTPLENQSLKTFDSLISEIYSVNENIKDRINFLKNENRI